MVWLIYHNKTQSLSQYTHPRNYLLGGVAKSVLLNYNELHVLQFLYIPTKITYLDHSCHL